MMIIALYTIIFNDINLDNKLFQIKILYLIIYYISLYYCYLLIYFLFIILIALCKLYFIIYIL